MASSARMSRATGWTANVNSRRTRPHPAGPGFNRTTIYPAFVAYAAPAGLRPLASIRPARPWRVQIEIFLWNNLLALTRAVQPWRAALAVAGVAWLVGVVVGFTLMASLP